MSWDWTKDKDIMVLKITTGTTLEPWLDWTAALAPVKG